MWQVFMRELSRILVKEKRIRWCYHMVMEGQLHKMIIKITGSCLTRHNMFCCVLSENLNLQKLKILKEV